MPDYLLDTNILLRLTDRSDPQHPVVRDAIRAIQAAGGEVYMTPQSVVEFWNVATRPADRNGFGLTHDEARRRRRLLERVITLLSDTADVYPRWKHLVDTVRVGGVQVQDTRLVAVMLAHGATHILTFNGADFARFAAPAGITVVDPAAV